MHMSHDNVLSHDSSDVQGSPRRDAVLHIPRKIGHTLHAGVKHAAHKIAACGPYGQRAGKQPTTDEQ